MAKINKRNPISNSEEKKEWLPGTHYKATATKTGEKGTSTTADRHNVVHREAKRTGETAVPLCTRDFDILI